MSASVRALSIRQKDNDSAWKDIIERFFYDMLERAMPDLYQDANRAIKPRFMDKELKKATYTVKGGKHVVDFLVEVPLLNGDNEWVLMHLECQGKGGESLPIRMYHYKSLIFAMYKREPVALAIITDKRPKNEPEYYESDSYRTKVTYTYNRLVVADLNERELLATHNPFDLALCAAKRALLCERDERQKHTYLKELLGFLGERGWNHEDKHGLLLFIENIINLNDGELWLDIVKYQEELDREGKIMYVSIAERVYRERWTKEGRQEGLQEGERKKALETARRMISRNMDIATIADLTGLSEDDVRNLLN